MANPKDGFRKEDFPILDYPGDGRGVIEPSRLYRKKKGFPERCVLTFFKDVLDKSAREGEISFVTELPGEGDAAAVYLMKGKTQTGSGNVRIGEEDVAIVFPGVGAPLAVCTLEEVIALGANRFVCCGGAGVLDKEISCGTLIVPNRALRDEGTSYHYQPRGRFSEPSSVAIHAIREILSQRGISFLEGPTWTTDAVFRETVEKIAKRKEEGCLSVEMEAAALFAAARFRNVTFGQILYAGDDVSGPEWKHREWMKQAETREELLRLAVEAVRRIP